MARLDGPKPQEVPELTTPGARAIINQNFSQIGRFFADRIEIIKSVTASTAQTLSVIKSENYIVIPVSLAGATLDVAPEVTVSTASFTVDASGTAVFDCLVLGV